MLRRSLIPVVLAGCALAGSDPLQDRVSVYRDNYGVPYIVGDTEEGVLFGYGYAQAQDHLERTMIQYRDAQGRRAEVQGFNALGDGYLQFILHQYRNRDNIEIYRILDAFARGINAYIREHRAAIPAWIDSVTAEDIEPLERSHYMRFYSIHDALSKLTGKTSAFPDVVQTGGPFHAGNLPTGASSTWNTPTRPGPTAFRTTRRTSSRRAD